MVSPRAERYENGIDDSRCAIVTNPVVRALSSVPVSSTGASSWAKAMPARSHDAAKSAIEWRTVPCPSGVRGNGGARIELAGVFFRVGHRHQLVFPLRHGRARDR